MDSIAPSSRPDVRGLVTGDLLALYGDLLDELNYRQVIRSRNPPAGDLAETLTALVYGGRMAKKSEKAWDVEVLVDGVARKL